MENSAPKNLEKPLDFEFEVNSLGRVLLSEAVACLRILVRESSADEETKKRRLKYIEDLKRLVGPVNLDEFLSQSRGQFFQSRSSRTHKQRFMVRKFVEVHDELKEMGRRKDFSEQFARGLLLPPSESSFLLEEEISPAEESLLRLFEVSELLLEKTLEVGVGEVLKKVYFTSSEEELLQKISNMELQFSELRSLTLDLGLRLELALV